MEFLFNNEALYRPGSFFSIRQELNKAVISTFFHNHSKSSIATG